MSARRWQASATRPKKSAKQCVICPSQRRQKHCCAMLYGSWGSDVREEFLDPSPADDVEEADEAGLRPRRLSEFVGQRELKEHLSIVLEAAKMRGQPADHLLLAGPPGLGKTSLAGIVAVEMGVH